MRAIAKAQVTRLAIQDHLIRILIIFRVPTSETCRHGNFVARLESNFAQCHGIDAGAEGGDCRVSAHHFFYGVRDHRRIGPKRRLMIGILRQMPELPGDISGNGIQPTDEEVEGKANQLVIGKIASLNLRGNAIAQQRSEEHTSELQSLMRISYAVFCLKKKKTTHTKKNT